MIIIGADMVPTKANYYLFSKGMINELVGEDLVKIIQKADYSIVNLEMPLTDADIPIDKYGPCLKAPKTTIEAYKKLGISFMTLANNHIMDFGNAGLLDTVDLLEKSGIAYAGVGKNIIDVKKAHIFFCRGIEVGIYCCAEHEFSIASADKMGVNPYGRLESYLDIKELKRKCNKVIVLYHGGKEHYRFPSEDLQSNCHYLVDAGADIVICQHSHCIGCEEKYKGSTIVYGQGNFLFDEENNEFWNEGLLISISDSFEVSYIPIVKDDEKVRLASPSEKERILKNYYERSEKIKDPFFLIDKYDEFAKKMLFSYLYMISGANRNIFIKILNRLTNNRFAKWYLSKRYNKNDLLMLQNYIECEAHRELLLRGLKKRIQYGGRNGF